MIETRTRRVIQGADYSGQEPKCLSALCKDPGMLGAYNTGKDLYVVIASIALHVPYKMCLEHFPKNCPIKKDENNHWFYAKLKTGEEDTINDFEQLDTYTLDTFDSELYDYDKLADGETDVYDDGKERRSQAKRILLGIMYGRGEKSIAEQLDCEVEEARSIKDRVYTAFPGIKRFEEESNNMVRDHGYVTTLWGRKRRLPNFNLPKYEYHYVDANDNIIPNMPVPQSIKEKYNNRIASANYKNRPEIIEEAKKRDQILIIDNGSLIAAAQRQIINSRVQGSSADMSKKALIKLHTDEELSKRGVKLIIPIHDEVLIETPLRYAKSVKKIFAEDMCAAPQDRLGIDMSVDVVTAFGWYHDELDLDLELEGLPDA